jgi:hypothetical protein
VYYPLYEPQIRLVRVEGLEPSIPYGRLILSQLRIPFRHTRICSGRPGGILTHDQWFMRPLLWDSKLPARKTILTGMLFSVYSFEQLFSIAEMICFDLSQF